MEKETTSFWADIKKYEDILAKDQRSYCFAPLSELYRKLGLLDDALTVAKRGTDSHPEYIGGYMALGRALFEMGKREEAKAALEKVALATPENLLAQKTLSQIYQEEGNLVAAEKALKVLVAFNPEDTESILSLEALQRSMQRIDEPEPVTAERGEPPVEDSVEPAPELSAPHNEMLDVPALDDSDDQEWLDFPDISDDAEEANPEPSDAALEPGPLPTVTLAELYEAQGFYDKAQEIYNKLLDIDPENEVLRERLDAVILHLENSSVPVSIGKDEDLTEPLTECSGPVGSSVEHCCTDEDVTTGQNPGGNVLETLELWLDAVRRRKECR